MSEPENLDAIEKLLRERDDYTADNGFTYRVMAALPKKRVKWLRPALLLVDAAVGAVLANQWLPWKELPPLDLVTLVSNPAAQASWIAVIAVVGSLSWAVKKAVQREETSRE
jgi:hypothetical protein